MSQRINKLDNEWASLREYIQRCPHLTADHRLIQAALEGSKMAKEDMEKNIRDEHKVEFEWERHIEACRTRQDPNDSRLCFFVDQLGVRELEYLIQQSKELRISNDSSTHEVRIKSEEGGDLGDDLLPLFLHFLEQFQTRHLHLRLETKADERTTYIITFERCAGFDTLPDAAPFVHLNVFRHIAYPNLAKVLAVPGCSVTSLVCGDNGESIRNNTAIGLLSDNLQKLNKLKEIDLAWFRLNSDDLGQIIDSLGHCRPLERFTLISVAFESEISPDHLGKLIQDHCNLQDIFIEEFEDELVEEDMFSHRRSVYLSHLPSHGNLQSIALPLHAENSHSFIPIIKQAAESATISNFKLDCGLEMVRLKNGKIRLHLFSHPDENCEDNLVAVVPQTPHLTDLRLNRMPQTIMNMFLSPTCIVSSLSANQPIEDEAMSHLQTCFQRYPHLKRLSLHFDVSAVIPHLCPKSSLEHLRLAFYPNSQDTLFPIAALALNEQQALNSLTLSPDRFEEGRISFGLFADALRDHPFLVRLEVGMRMADAAFVEGLFDAIKHKETFQELEFKKVPDVAAEVAVARGILKSRHLRNLFLPNAFDALGPALKQNLSICSLDRYQHSGIQTRFHDILVRNRLLRHAGGRQQVPLGLWPCLLAKLGSNNGEMTPVFDFLKR